MVLGVLWEENQSKEPYADLMIYEPRLFITLNNQKVFVHISSGKQKAVTGTAQLPKCRPAENDFGLNRDEQNISGRRLA